MPGPIMGACAGSVLFALLGLLVFFWGYRQHGRAAATASWPTTEGVIRESNMEQMLSPGATDDPWMPVVKYSYRIGGREHVSNRVGYMVIGSSNKAYAEGIVARYPVGKEVTVYYDPADHDTAVLEPGPCKGPGPLMLAGAVFTAFGLAVAAFLLYLTVYGEGPTQ